MILDEKVIWMCKNTGSGADAAREEGRPAREVRVVFSIPPKTLQSECG